MHVQQKYKILTNKTDRIPKSITDLEGRFERSTLARDMIFTPDTRSHIPQFVERFSLSPRQKGLFLRLREENDLTSGSGRQEFSLQAYRVSNEQLLVHDHVDIALDPESHRLADVLKFSDLLGLDKVMEVTKKRDEYTLVYENTSFAIYIDQVEGLAPGFVEVHATIDKNEEQELVSSLERLRPDLQLDEIEIILVPYYQQLLRQ